MAHCACQLNPFSLTCTMQVGLGLSATQDDVEEVSIGDQLAPVLLGAQLAAKADGPARTQPVIPRPPPTPRKPERVSSVEARTPSLACRRPPLLFVEDGYIAAPGEEAGAEDCLTRPSAGSPRTPASSSGAGETEAAEVADAKSCDMPLEVAGPERLACLAGTWRCVETKGLDEFLKASGVNVFQQKFAMAAKWPTWDFVTHPDRVTFVNHSALGDLTEEILVDGISYQHKDARGNLHSCKAEWQPSTSGGTLTIRRDGALGSFSEERHIEGDSLRFVLRDDHGRSWGRTFERA
mmetsp:Transcript_99388/g.195240  ORF Transcript_99388/g.195240 Transcript_99388/m.195240 type:complete len:294 (+) Transcript_99388:92-973(+)